MVISSVDDSNATDFKWRKKQFWCFLIFGSMILAEFQCGMICIWWIGILLAVLCWRSLPKRHHWERQCHFESICGRQSLNKWVLVLNCHIVSRINLKYDKFAFLIRYYHYYVTLRYHKLLKTRINGYLYNMACQMWLKRFYLTSV